jgi:CRISPR/Cas system CMR-associated protein Cmr5 small subunit
MKNLEQIRARNALKCQTEDGGKIIGEEGGMVIKKLPQLIMNHGLLATAAFAFEPRKDGYKLAFKHIARHLADPEIGILPADTNSLEKMVDHLSSDGDSQKLRNCTNESMAWLNYARRFVRKQD